MASVLCQLVFVAISIGVLLKIWMSKNVQEWRKNRLRLAEAAAKLPGLRGFPLIGNALIFACRTDEFLSRILAYSKFFEEPFYCWLGPKLIVGVTKPQDIQIIMQSTNAVEKDPIYRFAEKLFGRGLLTSSGPTFRAHRKMIVSMMNKKTTNSFVEYFDKHSQRCVDRLELRIDTGEFDVYPYMEYCAVDSALDTIMGTPGITQHDGYKDLMSCITRMYELVIDRMAKVWLHPEWIYACTNYKKLQDRSLLVISQFVENLVVLKKKEHYASKQDSEVSGTQRLMLLEQMVASNEKTGLMDDDRLKDEILTVFIAGEDSTTTVSSFVLLMLGMHPEIQEKVRTEVSEVLGEESVTEEKLSKLKYLDMVIKETLRLFPIGPVLLRKLTGDVHLESCTLPEGCSVAMIPFKTHRDPEFWSDPDNFDPERFTPENSIGRHSYAYVPFSGGIRGCIGKGYAMLYVKTIVAYVIRKYRLNSNSSLNELKLKSDIVIRSVNGYKISITRV